MENPNLIHAVAARQFYFFPPLPMFTFIKSMFRKKLYLFERGDLRIRLEARPGRIYCFIDRRESWVWREIGQLNFEDLPRMKLFIKKAEWFVARLMRD